ncbi:MAG: dynamin family protein [Planctomycetia bacterium]|nr:dynamin family protein [Planctomycetia bacterium]
MSTVNSVDNMSEKFMAKRDEIVRICDRAVAICKGIGQENKSKILTSFKAQMADEHFRVMVLGSFKRGKSTFINALLGEDVLPNFATPCTAVINEVKWNDEKEIHIHFKNPIPKQLPEELTPEAASHINRHANEACVPPITIPPSELEHYVVIPDPSKDQAKSITESPFDHAEVLWPLELCKNGIEIIDSPGLDEHESRTRVTERYLEKADVVLFVQSCSALAGKAEMDFIQNNLHAYGYEDIIFICNRFDEVREKERQRVIDYAKKKLGAVTKLGPDKGIFFISAYKALDGRLWKGDPENAKRLIDESGITDLESFLYTYLFENRGKIKIIHPAKKMLHEIVAIRKDVRDSKHMQMETLETLQKKAAIAHERAETEKKRIKQLIDKFTNKRYELKENVLHKAFDFYSQQYPCELVSEMSSFEPQTTLSAKDIFWKQTKIDAITEELRTALGEQAELIQTRWCNNIIAPMVKNQMECILIAIQDDIEGIMNSIENIRADLSGISVDQSEVNQATTASGVERLLAGVGGWVLTGPGGAMLGATFGYKEVLKNFGISLGLVVGATLLLGPLSPFAIGAIAIGSGSLQAMFKMKQISSKIKEKAVQCYVDEVREHSHEMAQQISDKIYESTENLAQLLSQGLNDQIQAVIELADNAVRDKEKGESESKKILEKLDESENTLDKLNTQLSDIIVEIAL